MIGESKSFQIFILFLSVTFFLLSNSTSFSGNKTNISQKELAEAKELFGSGPQEEDYWRTDELLLTATGSQIPVFKAPSVASLITKEDIEEMGVTSLDEILQTVPGLYVYPSGLSAFNSNWAIRGIHSSINPEVLLLINGIPLTQSYDHARPYSFKMPVAMISRVEVIRGPGSAIHGADAFSGVINVITKDNFEIDTTETGVRYGSFNALDTWLQHGGQYSGWDIWAGIEYQRSDGDENRIIKKDYMDANGLSAFSNTPGHLDTSYDIATTHFGLRKDTITLQLFGTWIKSTMGPGGLQAVTYDNEIKGTDIMADMQWRDKDFTANWDLSLRLSYIYIKTDNYFDFFPNNFLSMIGNPVLTDHQGGFVGTALYDGFNRHLLRLSTGLKYYDTKAEEYKNFGEGIDNLYGTPTDVTGTPYVFMEDQDRRLFFLSAQDEWFLSSDITFTIGVRWDKFSDFGSTVNPRLALVWEPEYWITSKLLYGRAFRAPSFAEQHVQNNPMIDGNPDIKPETIDTYELVFDLQPTKKLHSIISFFFYEAKEMIEYIDDGSASVPKAQNTGEREGYGFEVEIEWKLFENFLVRSYFAYQQSEDTNTGDPIADVPEMQFSINPHWNFYEDWSLDAQYYWVGEMHRAADDPREQIDDFGVINMTLRKKNLIGKLDGAISIRNLLDEDGRTPSPYNSAAPEGAYIPDDYPIEGRSIWLELRYTF